MPALSVVIITLNEQANILRCLESVRPFASEIVVVDSGSSDRTVEICRNSGCLTIYRKFDGYGMQKQFAIEQAAHHWIFSIDADEVVTPELRIELEQFAGTPIREGPEVCRGYYIQSLLHFMGKTMRFSGKTWNLRLFDRRAGSFSQVPVHEKVILTAPSGRLKERLIHYSYRDISHHIEKINFYTSRAAEGNANKRKHYFKCWVAIKPASTFVTFYFIRLGLLDGYPGFMWAFLGGFYASLKVAKTIELTSKP